MSFQFSCNCLQYDVFAIYVYDCDLIFSCLKGMSHFMISSFNFSKFCMISIVMESLVT